MTVHLERKFPQCRGFPQETVFDIFGMFSLQLT